MSGIPLVIKGKFKNIKLTIHGENHSDIDNSYYEALKFPASAVLLVEHSTNACEIKPEDEHLFRRHAKGTEWVFFTQKKAGHPNVICFDTRAEQGYLNAFEERELRRIADKFHEAKSDQVRMLIDGVLRSMRVFTANKEFYSLLPGYFDRSYSMIEGQLKALLAVLKYRKAKSAREVMGMPIDDLLNGLASTLIDNVVKIGSVSADLSLIGALALFAQSKPSEIHVFCGKNHAIRMTEMADLTAVKITGPVAASLRQSANIALEGDPEMDRLLADLK